jgi:hypothetical protein
VHGVDPGRSTRFHTGFPTSVRESRQGPARRAGAIGHLTFGLLSPDKGIEYVIDALPRSSSDFRDRLHRARRHASPREERHGEAYRLMLRERAPELGVDAT